MPWLKYLKSSKLEKLELRITYCKLADILEHVAKSWTLMLEKLSNYTSSQHLLKHAGTWHHFENLPHFQRKRKLYQIPSEISRKCGVDNFGENGNDDQVLESGHFVDGDGLSLNALTRVDE